MRVDKSPYSIDKIIIGVKFDSYNVLDDEGLREGIKDFTYVVLPSSSSHSPYFSPPLLPSPTLSSSPLPLLI